MDYVDLTVCCPRKAVKLNHALTLLPSSLFFYESYLWLFHLLFPGNWGMLAGSHCWGYCPGGLCNADRMPVWNSREISFAQNSLLSHLIVLKFCTEHGSITAMLCVRFQNDRTIEADVWTIEISQDLNLTHRGLVTYGLTAPSHFLLTCHQWGQVTFI